MNTQADVIVEPTAHPRARKFILDRDVRTGDPVGFTNRDACDHVPLAVALLSVPGVTDVHFAANVITVTTLRGVDWNEVEAGCRAVLAERLAAHDPAMRTRAEAAGARPTVGELAVIDGILEQTIRPYIRSHGGEVDLLHYDAETCRLLVSYQGTCGHCPASTTGTLEIIQQILRDQFDPRIVVETLS